jgi:hypothetical protein
MTSEPLLPRRPFLGVGVRATDDALGLEVTRVLPRSMGASAGLAVGDHLLLLDDRRLDAVTDIVTALRDATTKTHVHLVLRRDEERVELDLRVVPFPSEEIPGATVRYRHVTVGEHRLRTIQTFPEGEHPAPSVFFLPGISCASQDYAQVEHAPTARFLSGLAAQGFATLRLERHGLGDSEGLPCASIDFTTEHASLSAALDAWRAEPGVDPDRVVLFGHSVGGMHAPMLARAARGVVSYGSSARRWSRCLSEGMARQLALEGALQHEVDEAVADFDADPFPDEGRYGRCAAYHRQLEATDLEAAWRSVKCPVLVLIGGFDVVVGEEEQREIASFVDKAEIVTLSNLDHAFTWHPTLDESLERLGGGEPDARVAEEVARWIGSL